MFLLDSDTLSQVLKRIPSPALLARLAAVPPEQQFTSAIAIGQMVYGAYRSPHPEQLLQRLDGRLSPNVRVLPFDRPAAEKYGRLRAELQWKEFTELNARWYKDPQAVRVRVDEIKPRVPSGPVFKR